MTVFLTGRLIPLFAQLLWVPCTPLKRSSISSGSFNLTTSRYNAFLMTLPTFTAFFSPISLRHLNESTHIGSCTCLLCLRCPTGSYVIVGTFFSVIAFCAKLNPLSALPSLFTLVSIWDVHSAYCCFVWLWTHGTTTFIKSLEF